MLKFYRNIRKPLINSSSAKKYLLYAIGEIALVVIGILIALQINNWNEWRKDREMEKEILFEIRANLVDDIDRIDRTIDVMTIHNKSGDYILNAFTNKIPYSDSLSLHFSNGYYPGFTAINGMNQAGYTQYKNVGFEVIRNDSLKRRIIRHFESDSPTEVSKILYESPNRSEIAEYRYRNFRISGHFSIPKDYDKLLNDEYTYDLYAQLNRERGIKIFFARRLKEASESLLQLIKEELGEE